MDDGELLAALTGINESLKGIRQALVVIAIAEERRSNPPIQVMSIDGDSNEAKQIGPGTQETRSDS